MTIKEYTLSDVEEKLNKISNVSIFLSTGSFPQEIVCELQEHMHKEIESLQYIISYMSLHQSV